MWDWALGEPDGGVGPAVGTAVVSVGQGAPHLYEGTRQTLVDAHHVFISLKVDIILSSD